MEDEQIDNKKKFDQELYQFLRNNWGKILFLGIILTLYDYLIFQALVFLRVYSDFLMI